MVKIIYADHSGTEREVDANVGESVMEAAVRNNIPGIDADCGGACACATCHVYVDPEFLPKTGEQEAMEQSMLDFADGVQENSRLSCQISVSAELEGMKVTTPESQH
ncbi:2Fe-2S iron-sulfur cluster-binding protein [Ponticaulis sp.]|uniref:2Fe-2S iron-sulfur cluster-binding protein n=1 Tax=Ponticaulis sp. TaxID=2020902 RepID=UPI000B69F2A1|nr:2Fe-2S iron-sulfur cluster-binding protein [Ponticaulis sp.]RPG18328.1 MAG: 2Fe-2S ferredoxin [Hyphomonadaceae bacterium TMED125]HBH89967.1 2Fe-2S ferredoxin [Hyphomonadaceae bacterium]MAJ08021.1 2Fe-2S ferredoxin [Ponticaulis sp.]MDF1679320.1 2Fe-2S iron-sulfur cluster-binding protein [Ponticaulis sp.]HBJ94050.1 2Fe-2S ferredoxin [Hyphomonadaceae bacterium]|tara:strand:+ start:28088 stop:28408 length:321 start_codon:yes stop_codon:yes gene_type:complete